MTATATPPVATAGARPGQRTSSDVLADLDRPAALAGGPPLAVTTGFAVLDEVLGGGVAPGHLVIVGGKPGVGKTVLALQAARAAARSGVTAVYACYEHGHAALVGRLLLAELREAAERRGVVDALRLDGLRSRIQAVAAGAAPLAATVAGDDLVGEAVAAVAAYGDRLRFVTASGSATDVAALEQDLVDAGAEGRRALFVDYLQKVPVRPAPADEAEHVRRVVEGLKDLALRHHVPVVAIAAADRDGLLARRVRLHHLRGSTAVSYEADVVLMLNDKESAVSKVHSSFDTTRLEQFRRQVVASVEKNRAGAAGVHLELTKDFGFQRFAPNGGWMAERLGDDDAAHD